MSKSARLNCANQSSGLRSSKRAITFCLALAGAALAALAPSAKADSYLDLMINGTPDFIVRPYNISITNPGIGYHISTDFGGSTMIAPTTGGNPFGGFLDIVINDDSNLLNDSLTLESVGSMFSSTTLLDFGAVADHLGISYYFAFRQDGSTAYANDGDVIGGLLTVQTGTDLSGNIINTATPVDFKAFVFAAVPAPAAVQGGALLMGVVAVAGICRRFRSSRALGSVIA